MNLYIRLVDGQPFEHPIFEDNFRQAFPNIDTNNLPSNFARFTRVAPPAIGVYEVYEGCTYERQDDGSYMDVHATRAMTDAEKTAKQDAVKAGWAATGYASWVFDEDTCTFNPPTPYPTDGNAYQWDEESTAWVEVV